MKTYYKANDKKASMIAMQIKIFNPCLRIKSKLYLQLSSSVLYLVAAMLGQQKTLSS